MEEIYDLNDMEYHPDTIQFADSSIRKDMLFIASVGAKLIPEDIKENKNSYYVEDYLDRITKYLNKEDRDKIKDIGCDLIQQRTEMYNNLQQSMASKQDKPVIKKHKI